MQTITRAFTVIATPDHLRAAETIDRPISILLIGSLTAALGRI